MDVDRVERALPEEARREQPGVPVQDHEVSELPLPGALVEVGGELAPLLDRHEHPVPVPGPEGERVPAVPGPDLELQAARRGRDHPGPVRVQVERDGCFVLVRKIIPGRSLVAFR